MDKNSTVVLESSLHEIARFRKVDEDIVVFRIVDSYCQVIWSRRWVLGAYGQDMRYSEPPQCFR